MEESSAGSPGPSPDEALIPLGRCFQIGDREIVVRPLVIGRLKEIMDDLGKLAQEIATRYPGIDLAKPEEHLASIFSILPGALGRIFQCLFGIEETYLDEHLTLAQASEIICALLEVNQVPDIRKNALRALHLAKTIAIP